MDYALISCHDFFPLLFTVDLFPSLSCLLSSSPPSSCYTSGVNTPEARPSAKVSSHSNFPWHSLPLDLNRAFTWQNAEIFISLILVEEGSFSDNMEGNNGSYYWYNSYGFFFSIIGAKLWQKYQLDCWLLTLNNGFSFFWMRWELPDLKECFRDSTSFKITASFSFSKFFFLCKSIKICGI